MSPLTSTSLGQAGSQARSATLQAGQDRLSMSCEKFCDSKCDSFSGIVLGLSETRQPGHDLIPLLGVGKGWGMPPLEVAEPFGGSNEGLLENLHLFRIDSSSDGTGIVISPGESTAQPGWVLQETEGSCNGSLCFVRSRAQWARIDRLTHAIFHVAAHHFMQLCKNNCHVLNVIHMKSFGIELSCFKCDYR